MIARILILAAALAAPGPHADPVACELVDLATAETLLGEGTLSIGDESEPSVCWYQNAATMLIVQVFDDGYFQAVVQAHTPVDVGDEGRVSEDENGVVTVQFLRGEFSVTMTVRPNPEPEASYRDAMLEIARQAAGRMP